MAWPTHIVAVAGLVEDGKGNVLLGRSSYRQTWEFLGGQVELGENLEEALLREIREEAGVTAAVKNLVGIYSNVQETLGYDGKTRVPPKLVLDFLCEYLGGEPVASSEHTQVRWVPREDALALFDHPAFAMRLKNMLNFSGKVIYQAYSSQPYVEHLKRVF